jgi:hypothetical protein
VNVSSSQQSGAFPLWGSTAYSAPFASSTSTAATAAPAYSSVNLNVGRAPSPHLQGQQQQQQQQSQHFGGFEKTNSKFDAKSSSLSGNNTAAASAASFAKEAWDDPSLAAFEDTRIESPPPTQADRMEDEDDSKYNDKYSTNKDEFEEGESSILNYRAGSPDINYQQIDEYVFRLTGLCLRLTAFI